MGKTRPVAVPMVNWEPRLCAQMAREQNVSRGSPIFESFQAPYAALLPPPQQSVLTIMLTRSARPLHPIITAARANNSYLKSQHLFRRELSGFTTHRANPDTIKYLEAEIKRINADSSLSASFKYRNSVRLFAMLDQAKNIMEMKALRANSMPVSTDRIIIFLLERTIRRAKIRREGLRSLLRGRERGISEG